MKNIAIFSHKDTGAGQLLNMLPEGEVKKINFLILINNIKKKYLTKIIKLNMFEIKNFKS